MTQNTPPILKYARCNHVLTRPVTDAFLPRYHSAGAACFDLHATYARVIVSPDHPKGTVAEHIQNGKAPGDDYYLKQYTIRVGTGLAFEIPEGYALAVFVRSSMGKRGLTMTNGTGIIDSDYRGEVMVNLQSSYRNTDLTYMQAIADELSSTQARIAQAMLIPAPQANLILTKYEDLTPTERGTGGFGSTGR